MKAAFVFPPAWAPWAPSYGMGLLTAAGKKRGHEIVGFDLSIDLYNHVSEDDKKLWNDDEVSNWLQPEPLAEIVARYEPFIDKYADAVVATGVPLCGISVNTASSLFALRFAEKIKKRNPEIFILMGGPDCFRSERGMTLLDDPNIDAICVCEGDHVWPDFLDMFEQNGFRPSELKGICYRAEDGSIVDNGDADIVTDLDSLPFPDYESIDFSKYSILGRASMMMSRGCINRCAYCSEGPNFLRYRYRSAKSLFEETKELVTLLRDRTGAAPFINYCDSLINGRPDVLEEFCDIILSDSIEFSWGGMALLREEMTREFLAKMNKAGFIEVMWGLESGSAQTLKLMRKKRFTPELAERIFKDVQEIGIIQVTNIIVGFPGETEELFLESAEFLIRNNHYFLSIGLPLMTVRRNSYVYDHYQDYNIEDPDNSLTWKTLDESNTYALRIARRNLLSMIVQEKVFQQGKYDKDLNVQ